MTNDGFHTYTYDAEGNIMTVDGGSTASYIYDALNHRGRTIVGGEPTEFVYNVAGQRATTYVGFTGTVTGQYYWGGKRVAFYKGGSLHFQHQDWLGTERTRTTYNGAVEGTFTSLPFGDGLTTASGTDTDAYHFATVDHDYETDTEHAQFRQLSSAQGRFLSLDPYGGSYDPSNPQSFNRYVYVMNNPLSNVDPSGQECVWDDGSYDSAGDPDTGTAGGCGAAGGTFIDPAFFESVQGNQPGSWSGQASSAVAFNWLTPSVTVNATPGINYTIQIPTNVWNWAALQTKPVGGLWHYGNWAGPGGSGAPTDDVDAGAMLHDYCYANASGGPFTASSNFSGYNAALQSCNQALCDTESQLHSQVTSQMLNMPMSSPDWAPFEAMLNASGNIKDYFSLIPLNGNACH